ncbi:MAG TPA: GntR family transcriptional regulator [Ilumatobacter sp.]|nr:GntR family transcriptional regulator [Ilumatobacter sp.]
MEPSIAYPLSRSLNHRVAYQRRRAMPDRSNKSLQRTYDLLRSHLHSIEPGGLLVEADLVRSLSSSRNAVRAALQLMAAEGLVARKTKVGTTSQGATFLPLNDILSDRQKTNAYGIHTGIATSIILVPELIRIRLRLEEGSSVAVIDGLIYAGGEPIGTSVGYVGLSASEAIRFPNQNLGTVSFLEESLQVELGDCETRMATASCDAETAHRLSIEEGSAMFWLEDLIRDVDGRPRAIKQARFRGDRVAFSAVARRAVA